MKYDLRKVQLIELQALLEVDRICAKHNLEYYLIAGSALGAIRHKGFIPWDEDIDIGMMRDQYEQFLEIAKKELDKKYFLQTNQTDPSFVGLYSKIRINGTTFIEKETIKLGIKLHQGIFIDIFPLDNVGDNPVVAQIQYKLIWFFNSMLSTKIGIYSKTPLKKALKKIIAKVILPLVPMNLMKRLAHKIATSFDNKNTIRVANILGYNGLKKLAVPREFFGEPVYTDFEGLSLPVPQQCHEYLENVYGDYMSLPPEDKRGSHNVAIIDTERSYEFYIR